MLDNKGGSSSSSSRIALIDWVLENLKDYKINSLNADREFPSNEFLIYLIKNKIPFLMRSKGNIKIKTKNGHISMKKLYNYMLTQTYSLIRTKTRRIFGCDVYLSIRTNDKNELVYLISDQYHADPFELYANRWKIEVMFGNYKSRGFDLESTKITDLNRLNNFFMMLSLCYCFCCKFGIIRDSLIKIPVKNIKEGGKTRTTNEFTFYKYGFDFLKSFFSDSMMNIKVAYNQFIRIVMNDIDKSYYENTKISMFMRCL